MPSTSSTEWQVATTLPDHASAQLLATRFRSEGVPAEVVDITPRFLGESGLFEVRVPFELAHRARWLMSQAQVSEAELIFLATGELGDADRTEK